MEVNRTGWVSGVKRPAHNVRHASGVQYRDAVASHHPLLLHVTHACMTLSDRPTT